MGPSELAKLLRYVFDVKGRRRLTEEELVRTMAFDRHWMVPRLARLAVAAGAERGLIGRSGEREFVPEDDLAGFRLPIDYAPDVGRLESELSTSPAGGESKAAPLFRRIVRRIASLTSRTDAEVVAAINAQQAAMGSLLTAEVAAILYGRGLDLEMTEFYGEAEKALRVSPKGS